MLNKYHISKSAREKLSDSFLREQECTKQALSEPCPFGHKTPPQVLEGMLSCPNLRAWAQVQKEERAK